MVSPHEHDHFVLRQWIRPVINRYEFALPDAEDQPFCFVEQKRFKFKEDIRFFTDKGKEQELMRIKARQRFDPRARYDITSATGEKIGEIQKVFGTSLFRSTYKMYNGHGQEVAHVQEASLPIALLRRVIGFVPFVEMFSDWVPIPYDFEILAGDSHRLGISTRRRWKFRDTYDIDMSGDPNRSVDRRLVLALSVGIDALQAR